MTSYRGPSSRSCIRSTVAAPGPRRRSLTLIICSDASIPEVAPRLAARACFQRDGRRVRSRQRPATPPTWGSARQSRFPVGRSGEIYYGPDGRPRGYSRSPLGTWLWHGSLIGLFIQFCLAVFLIPLYYFPRAVWHSRLEPLAKVAIIGGAWGGVILLGVIANAHTASQARGAGVHRHRHRPEGLLRPQRRGQQVSGRLSAGAQAWPWVRGSQHATIPVDQRTAGRVCRTPGRGDRARFSAAGSRPRPLHSVLHGRHADRCPVACVTATDNHRSETLSDSAGPFAVHLAVRRGR